jgi:replication factor A1
MEIDAVLQRIIATTGMNNDDLERKIAEKQRELSGLVSREGAAYIIAKELGLELFEKTRRRLEIKNVIPGLKNVTLTARIVRMFEPRQFEKDGQKSAVANVILGDGSGSLRLSLWDQQCQLLKQLQPGLAVEVFGAYTKDDSRGGTEIRLSKRGGLKVLPNSDLPGIDQIKTA